MSFISSLFSVSWAAWGSSLLLIIWGALHVPGWRKKENRWEHWRDTLMLFALGVIDWTYAIKSHVEVEQMQDVVGPRHLVGARRQLFVHRLMQFSKPLEPVDVIITTLGTERQRDEQLQFGHEIEATFEEAGWGVHEIAGPTQPARIGLQVVIPKTTPEMDRAIELTNDTHVYSGLGVHAAFQNSGLQYTLDTAESIAPIRIYVWQQM